MRQYDVCIGCHVSHDEFSDNVFSGRPRVVEPTLVETLFSGGKTRRPRVYRVVWWNLDVSLTETWIWILILLRRRRRRRRRETKKKKEEEAEEEAEEEEAEEEENFQSAYHAAREYRKRTEHR